MKIIKLKSLFGEVVTNFCLQYPPPLTEITPSCSGVRGFHLQTVVSTMWSYYVRPSTDHYWQLLTYVIIHY